MVAVAEVAQAAGVSQAAVRARLAEGTLAGVRVDRDGRQVWEVDDAAAQRYVATHQAARSEPPAPSAGAPAQPSQDVSGPAPVRQTARRAAGAVVRPSDDAGGSGVDVAALLRENEGLRVALASMSRAHAELSVALSALVAGPGSVAAAGVLFEGGQQR